MGRTHAAEDSPFVPFRRMHTNEVEIDAALVRRLLERAVSAVGNAAAGARGVRRNRRRDLSDGRRARLARLPRIEWAVRQVDIERTWMPGSRRHSRSRSRLPFATGTPGADYPWEWAIHRWIPGENFAVGRVDGLEAVALNITRSSSRCVRSIRTADHRHAGTARESSCRAARHRDVRRVRATPRRHRRRRGTPPVERVARRRARGTTTRCGSTPTCCRAT